MIRACNYFFRKERALLSSHGARPVANISEEFTFVSPIPEDREEDVVVHLRNFFFKDDPVHKAIGSYIKPQPHKTIDPMVLEILSQGLSVMAVDKGTDELAGVCVNTVELPGSFAEKKIWAETICPCAKFKQVIILFNTINEPLHLHNRYGVDEIFEIFLLSTDAAYRRKGLGGKLVKASEDIARENDFKVMKGNCTGAYSQKVFTSAGFESVYELKYADYHDENKQPIFKVEPPHDSVKVMVKELK